MDDPTPFMDCATASSSAERHGASLTLNALPVELLLQILSHLGTRDVGACAMTGRALAFACQDHSLWMRLYEHEQANQEARWRAAAEPVAVALSLCSDWTHDQVRQGKHKPEYVLAGIVADIADMLESPWHASIDLALRLGHPRFACAARANVRVLMDSFDKAPCRNTTTPADRTSYASVGTIIRCAGARYMCKSRVTIQRGFFDADGVLCGPGLTHFYWHHDGIPHPVWLGCAGLWNRGRVTASNDEGDAVYQDGCRYRGGLLDGLCHGQGRIYDSKGVVLVAGHWKRNVAHGPCSWRQEFYGSGSVQKWVANATSADGLIDGPIAYFAEGRLVMRIPRPYPRRLLTDFAEKCAFLTNNNDNGWSRLPHYTTVHYGPSGVTVTSDAFFAHRWTDGALTLGDMGRQRYPSRYVPRLLVIFGHDGGGGDSGAPLLVALGTDSAFHQDQRTLAATMRAGQTVDVCHHPIVNRGPIDAATPPGLEPDDNSVDTHLQDMACDGDTTKDRCNDDHSLSQKDFAHAIASASPVRVGVDEHDATNMSDDVRAASIDLLHFLDAITAPPASTVSHGQPQSFRGGRVRDALYVASAEPVQKTENLDMSHCVMRGCVVVGATFKGCDFRHTRFERCVFYACSFVRCAFFGATLVDTQFETCGFAYDHRSTTATESSMRADAAELILGALGATILDRK
nr:F-box domain containing protein [Pandoravirus aubagnensis]